MKRLVGGDYLLDLSSIELEESEDGSTKTNITDSNVLEQLTNLKKYINNPEMAKPVWIKLKNGENDELVIARGTFAVVDTGEFEICVQLDGYKLVIFIEFTQVLNSDDEPLDDWYIDTNDAKYLFTTDAQNVKATIEDADFGDVELAGDLSVGGDLSVTGDISGDAITGDSIIENMTGYSFVPNQNDIAWNPVYAGIVKNGNKLTYVIFGSITVDGTQTGNADIGTFVIPNDINAKLYPYSAGGLQDVLDNFVLTMQNTLYDYNSIGCAIIKASSGFTIRFGKVQEIGIGTSFFRVEGTFLLSENLVPESHGE